MQRVQSFCHVLLTEIDSRVYLLIPTANEGQSCTATFSSTTYVLRRADTTLISSEAHFLKPCVTLERVAVFKEAMQHPEAGCEYC